MTCGIVTSTKGDRVLLPGGLPTGPLRGLVWYERIAALLRNLLLWVKSRVNKPTG
jgi:hypothetical protein